MDTLSHLIPARLSLLHRALLLSVCLLSPGLLSTSTFAQTEFIRGDADGNGSVDELDVERIIQFVFGEATLPCLAAGDANGDAQVALEDATYLGEFLNRGGAEPPAPFPDCGEDPLGERLACDESSGCDDVAPRFLRGDADGDGILTITDGVFTLNFLFLGGRNPSCEDAADTDDSGLINITDPVSMLTCLFLGGVCPPPGCNEDLTDDELGCEQGCV